MRARLALAGSLLLTTGLCAALLLWRGGRTPAPARAGPGPAPAGERPEALARPAPAGTARDAVPEPSGELPAEGRAAGSKDPAAGVLVVVTDPEGGPLEGARVRFLEDDGEHVQLTGADGTCRLTDRPEGSPGVHVDADGYQHRDEGFGRVPRVEIALRRVAGLRGRVLEADTRSGVAGAEVWLATRDCGFCEQPRATADERGAFVLPGVPLRGPEESDRPRAWTESQVHAAAPGFVPATRAFVLRREDSALELELARGADLWLEVVDGGTGLPIEGARVERGPASAVAGPDGTLRTDRLVEAGSDSAWLTASAGGYLTLSFSVDPVRLPRGEPLRLPLVHGAQITGCVRDEQGLPIEGATLFSGFEVFLPVSAAADLPPGWTYHRPRDRSASGARTEADGRFRLDGLRPETEVSVIVQAEGRDRRKATVTTGLPGQMVERDFVLPTKSPPPASLGTIRGRVHSGGQGRSWRLSWKGATLSGSGRADDGGRFVLAGVEPGRVVVRVRTDAWNAACAERIGSEHPVEVPEGGTADLEIDVGLSLAAISGRVVRADGSPAAGLGIGAWADESCIDSGDRTDGDGHFELWVQADVASYALHVRHGPEGQTVEGVAPGSADVQIVLGDLAQLSWRAVDALTGRPVPGTTLLWMPAGDRQYRDEDVAEDPEGWHVFELARGSYDLGATTRPGRPQYLPSFRSAVRVEPGMPPVTFELEEGLELRLVLAEGLAPWPADGLSVLLLDDPRFGAVSSSRPGSIQYGPELAGWGLESFMVSFGPDRTCHLRGLSPGRHRFRALPDTVALEPAEIAVAPGMAPVEVRWMYR